MTDISPEAVERMAKRFIPLHPQVSTFTVLAGTGTEIAATLRAQAARIIELEAQLATARNDALDAAAEAGDRENQRRLNLASIRIPALWDELRPVILALKTETPT
ncbi:hypothetical protein A8B82_14855 [Sulfitobacter sp. EhC04]|uniref:hypothetical protein n=1 Tax=Sulfitobacter sp. EhC04 TaxID=1849168 RepID=UPI0007F4A94C|nr:hypothetical protein [Sulfitobacter sp. EhC04]OAN76676.1 hypothetical protein A8B82_14855 [Sulfitobacter sp. EhC04]